MRVVITGANGFIGKNLRAWLMQHDDWTVVPVTSASTSRDLHNSLKSADVLVHLAGVNRPRDPGEFVRGNTEFTLELCNIIRELGRPIPLLFSSSIHAGSNSAYGLSKRLAEGHVFDLHEDIGSPVAVYRLPNVFGKWARPNYNSVVATFCYNTARGLPLTIRDPAAQLQLTYIDDVLEDFTKRIEGRWPADGRAEITSVYETSVGQLAEAIQSFRSSRTSLITESVGTGLLRALYATYVSYLAPDQFTYDLPKFEDSRGVFVEVLKTREAGQFSFFSAHPGVTRGEHYHHTKTEKFLVLRGNARFAFRHILTGETYQLEASGDHPRVVESIPGWAHNITNIGQCELLVMLWANEMFDRTRPDTYAYKV